MNEVIKTIKNRRSIRSFSSEQIKEEELNAIIEAGIYAPSGQNNQPWYFTVIQDSKVIDHINQVAKEVTREIIEKKEKGWELYKSFIERRKAAGLTDNFYITYGAPTLIIVSGKKNSAKWKHTLCTCGAAIQNILLTAESLNIGSVWLDSTNRCFSRVKEAEKIGIPEDYEILYGIALGYKKQKKQPEAPERNYNVINFIK